MYRYRNQRKKSFIRRYGSEIFVFSVGIGAASLGFLGPASSDIDTESRVFAEGLEINLDRGSPAFAALEDTWITPAKSQTESAGKERIAHLDAGGSSAAGLAERLVKENRRELALIEQERASREANAQIMAQAASQMLQKMLKATRFKPKSETAAVQEIDPSKPVQKISLSELRISRDELLGTLFLPIAQSKKQAPESKSAIQFRRAASVAPERSRDPRTVDPSRPQTRSTTESSFLDRKPGRDEGEFPNGELAISSCSAGAKPARQITVSGPLQFAGGLALTNPMDRVVVYREVDGEPVESGAIWLREARYEIFVEETAGQVIGELRTPYGDVIGRGIIDLACVGSEPHAPARVATGVALAIKPVTQGIAGRVLAGESRNRRPLKATEVLVRDLGITTVTNNEGHYTEASLLEGSNVIVKALRPGYWGTLAFAHAGETRDIEMFPDRDGFIIRRLVTALKTSRRQDGGIVWGRITYNGKPVAGARAELITTNEAMRPVYFNAAMLPDPTLEETSSNGMYAFFPVSPGAHAVQAVWRNGRATEPQIFPTEIETVSRVDVEAATDRVAKVKVFDAFQTGYPLSAEISNLGATRTVSIDRTGSREIKYADGQGLLMMEAQAGAAYERVRIALNRDRRQIYFPMIQTSWINQMRGHLRVSMEPGLGTIVGFVQGSAPYKVKVEGLSGSSRVAYFNSRGEPTSEDHGEPGGGFVILNVAEGFRTVAVQASGSMKSYAAVALVERNVTNVISHWIR